jgi:RNA 3'-terminal phosphate cyclase
MHSSTQFLLGRSNSHCYSPALGTLWNYRWAGTQSTWTINPARAHASAPLKIKKRGSPPLGGGEVLFFCPIVKQVKTLNFVEIGKIKRIRGIAYATSLLIIPTLLKIPCRHAVRVSPQFSNRMIEAARSVLNRYIPDIYLYSDVYKGEESGK